MLNLYNNGDSSEGTTIVSKSSFSFCQTYCIYAQGHRAARIEKNVFYHGGAFHLKLKRVKGFTVDANLMIGAVPRPRKGGPVACLESTGSFSLVVKNNICKGSTINGFVFPLTSCSQFNSMPFTNNVAGSISANGFLLNKEGGGGCLITLMLSRK
mgnify:CR=1 FL=1